MSHIDGTDMNLKRLKSGPSEVTETDTASLDEMNNLNLARDELDKTHNSDQLNGIEEKVVDGVFEKMNINNEDSDITETDDHYYFKDEKDVVGALKTLSIEDKESDITDNGDQLSIEDEKAAIGALRTLSIKYKESDITNNGDQLNMKEEKAVIESFGKLTIKDKKDIVKAERPTDRLNDKDKGVEINLAQGLKAAIPERDIQKELKKRGPMGGIPVSNGVSPEENQYMPTEDLYQQQQQPNYAALNGRRMLDDADQPPRKFVAAPNFNPQLARQKAKYNVNNLNQEQMPATYNSNFTYQPGQVFGLSQSENLTSKNIAADQTATVNLFQETGPQNFVDELLDDWEVFQTTQNNGMNLMAPNTIPISESVTNVYQPESLRYPTPQPYMSLSSHIPGSIAVPVTSNSAIHHEACKQVTGPSLTRHRSDLSDSGVSSAGQASPYSDSVPSPDKLTHAARLSVDSGFGTNSTPTLVMPQLPTMQTSNNATYSPSDLDWQCQETNGLHSVYMDEYLYGLQDAVDVIADDTIHDNDGSASQPWQNKEPVCRENGNFQPVASATYDHEQLPMMAELTPAKTCKQTVTPVSSNITTNILPQKQPFVEPPQQPVRIHNKPTISTVQTLPCETTTKPVPTQKPFFAPSPQRVDTKTVAVFILSPNMTGNSETAPGFQVPRMKIQNKEPARQRLREIRPKPVPINDGTETEVNRDQKSGNMGTQEDTLTSQNAGNKMVLGPFQPTAKITQTQSQPNHQATKHRQKRPLDSARRNLKAVKTETLKGIDEEGNTYLHLAICNEDRFAIKALLERIKKEKLTYMVDQENNDRQTPLFVAVAMNDPAKVQLLINAGANLNTLAQNLSSDGLTKEVRAAIHVASVGGKESLKTLEELLKGDVNINLVNNYGQTALHLAVLAHGKKQASSNSPIDSGPVIRALIKKGADPCIQDKESGRTPLMYAIVCKHISLVETILSVVEPSNIRNLVTTQAFDGSSCLKIAEETKKYFNTCDFTRLCDILQRSY